LCAKGLRPKKTSPFLPLRFTVLERYADYSGYDDIQALLRPHSAAVGEERNRL
jgi:hypothetical protein